MKCPDCGYPFATWKKCDNCGRNVSDQPFGCTMFFAAIFVGVVVLVIIAPKNSSPSSSHDNSETPPPKVIPVAPQVSPVSRVAEHKLKSNEDVTEFTRADAQLNVAYKNAMNRIDGYRQEQLRTEQRNWIKQRDAAVSRNPIESVPIKLKMTLIRTRELEQYR